MKIAILGLGYSLTDFNSEEFDLSIGVNDIWRIVKSDIVCCFNHPNDFIPDRLIVIQDCKPQAFFSQMVIWNTRPDFVKINILPGYPADRYCDLNLTDYYKSFCSPFIAVQIAFKVYHATEIHLFGCDMNNHPNLNGSICDKIKIHFINLKTALNLKNCPLIIHGQGILKDI